MGRALEANVFLDPDFALPAAQHLDVRRRPWLILVWADAARARTDLLAVWAVVDRAGPGRALAVSWLHELSTLGMPLLDGERAAGVIPAIYVTAVAVARHGTWPLPFLDQVSGDDATVLRYVELSRTQAGFDRFLDELLSRQAVAA